MSIDDFDVQVVPFSDGFPVGDTGAAHRINAYFGAGFCNGVHIYHAAQVGYIG